MNPQPYLNNFFWLFLTYLSAPYLYFRIFLLARRSPKDERGKKNVPAKILVIQVAKIGDLVCTTPVFREIKKKFPNSYLAALVIGKTKDILTNNPRLEEIISFDDFPGIVGKIKLIKKLKKEKYDWVFSLLPDSFNNIIAFWSLAPGRIVTTYKDAGEITWLTSIFNNHCLEYKRGTSAPKHYLNLLKFIDIKEYSEKREVFIKPAEEKNALDYLRLQDLDNNDLLIGMSVTAGVKFSEWEPSKFAALADQLIEKLKAKIIFVGSAADSFKVTEVQGMMENDSINSCGQFSLRELPALMKNLKLFVSVDTGPLYIADALEVPVVDIMGPSDMGEQCPIGSRSKIIQKDIHCSPCLFIFLGIRFCKEEHLKCLKETTVEEVFEAAQNLIKTTPYEKH